MLIIRTGSGESMMYAKEPSEEAGLEIISAAGGWIAA
jgi:hypothetical protein